MLAWIRNPKRQNDGGVSVRFPVKGGRPRLLSSVYLFGPGRLGAQARVFGSGRLQKSYLVDPASSHMLVSKTKPCMSKYKHLYTVKLRTAPYISNNLFDGTLLHGYRW